MKPNEKKFKAYKNIKGTPSFTKTLMVTDVNQEDPGPSHVGRPYWRPQGAAVLRLRLLKAKCQRAGCLSSGPGRAFLGASPSLHPWGRASITFIPFPVGGRCRVTALQHPPTPDFPGTCGFTEVLHPRSLYFRFKRFFPCAGFTSGSRDSSCPAPPPPPTLASLTVLPSGEPEAKLA